MPLAGDAPCSFVVAAGVAQPLGAQPGSFVFDGVAAVAVVPPVAVDDSAAVVVAAPVVLAKGRP